MYIFTLYREKKKSICQRSLGNSAIKGHEKNSTLKGTDLCIILLRLFKIFKKNPLLEFRYCLENELVAKQFLAKLHQFTSKNWHFASNWITNKVMILFALKYKNLYPTCQINKGTWVFYQKYINETTRNVHNWCKKLCICFCETFGWK